MITVWISVITAICGFFVSGMSIYLGYKLFLAGATGEFKFNAETEKAKVGIVSVAPGIGFAAFGMFIAIYSPFAVQKVQKLNFWWPAL
jgi:hypothetical protein